MSRRKLENRNIRKLYRTGKGGSISLTLPIALIRQLKWQTKQKVVVTLRGKTLIIKDWHK